MPDEKAVGMELHEMLTVLSDSRLYHLAEMDNDLAQINLLLKEAISTLSEGFMGIANAVREQNEMMEKLLENTSQSNANEWRQLSVVVDHYVDTTVRALQFEDMTTQLVARVRARVAGMREVSGILMALGAAVEQMHGSAEVARQLQLTIEVLAKQDDALMSRLSSQEVSQQCLSVGDVELF